MVAAGARSASGDERFFQALENGHSVRAACAAARYGRSSVYEWRERDSAFAERWRLSVAMGVGPFEDEAAQRGRDGTDMPVYFRGRACGAKRVYSDGLLLARLKAMKPEVYREPRGWAVPAILEPPEAQPQTVRIVIRDFLAGAEAATNGAMADMTDTRSLSAVSGLEAKDSPVK